MSENPAPDSAQGESFGSALLPATEIPPTKLLPEAGESELQRFLLSLAVFFNDLKGLVFLQAMLEKQRPPKKATPASGEWNGIVIQLRKLVYGALWELFGLMANHDELLDSPELMRLFKKKPARARKQWTTLVAISRGERDSIGGSSFIKSLVKIRNSVAFHYGQPKPLVAGFRRHFYASPTSERTRYALASLGAKMEETRYYYADAAVQAAIGILSGQTDSAFDRDSWRELRRVLDSVGNLLDAHARRAFRSA